MGCWGLKLGLVTTRLLCYDFGLQFPLLKYMNDQGLFFFSSFNQITEGLGLWLTPPHSPQPQASPEWSPPRKRPNGGCTPGLGVSRTAGT